MEGKTILVVEDQGIVARQLQLSLADLGYHVPFVASSAEEALRSAVEQPPDLVLMDIHLEGAMDGIETAALIREKVDVPVVYLTAYTDPATVERAKVTEPYGYLVKPVDSNKLRSVVEVALHKHEADRRLRLSEAKFSGIVSLAADAIIAVDEERRIVLFNESAEKIFGYSKAEAIGAPMEMLVPEKRRERHRRSVEEFAADPAATRRMEERPVAIAGRRKNGEEFPAEASISKLDLAGHKLLTVALRDISERKRIESEQRFLAEVGAVLTSTLDYGETLANISRLFVRELADWCVIELLDDADRAGAAAPSSICESIERAPREEDRLRVVSRVLETKQPMLLRDPASASVADDGVHSAMAVPMTIQGRILGVLLLGSGSRTYRPADLRLASDVAQRAAFAIENARLYRNAQEAINARDNLLAIVSHDLRTPLSTITLSADFLSDAPPEGERRGARRQVDAIQRASVRMKQLLDSLLDAGMIDAGKFAVEPRREDGSSIVEEAIEMLQPLASARSLRLVGDWGSDLSEVWCARERILQVLANLVGNAVKFSEPGGEIAIRARRAGDRLSLSVSDRGPGIPPDVLPHIFDRYWKGRARNPHGTGLGLYIVKGIVEAHGGRVEVESEVGKGTTFTFTIPLASVAEEPVAARGGSRSPSTA